MSICVDGQQESTSSDSWLERSSRTAVEEFWRLPSRAAQRLPRFWSAEADGVVAVHGEIDIANHHLFATVVDSVPEHLFGKDISRGEAHLDMADVGFIDVGGARMLVTAALKRGPGDQLVIHHPSATLVRMLRIGWGELPGMRFEPEPEPEPRTGWMS